MPNLSVIDEGADSDSATANDAFSNPSSVSSLDSYRLCMSPLQDVGTQEENRPTRQLEVPSKKRGHQRSRSVQIPFHANVRARKRSLSESDQMENKENHSVALIRQGELLQRFHKRIDSTLVSQ